MTSQSTDTLRSRYVTQVASDLAENHRRQQELAAQITELEQEETLLADILKLAEGNDGAAREPLRAEPAPDEPDAAAVKPGPKSAAAGTRSPRAAKVSTTSGGTKVPKGAAKPTSKGVKAAKEPNEATAAKGANVPQASKEGADRPKQPLLGALLMVLLGAHTEPRLAKELRDELMEKHPDRVPTPQVVRNTLESLVAKGRIRRHKQQRSVMYTLIEPDSVGSGKSAKSVAE